MAKKSNYFKFIVLLSLFLILYFLSNKLFGPSCNEELELSEAANSNNTIYTIKSACECRKTEIILENLNDDVFTCGLYNTLRRGYGQKVVSYSLYGSNLMYYSEIKYLSKLVAKYYPGWVIRIYYDNSINKTVICELECLKDDKNEKYMDNIDFCNINEIPYGNPVSTWSAQYMHSMKWRFLPIGDSFVDMFMSRDLDSWIIDREFEAVKIWFQSDKLFHIMRDHPYHDVPMLGGMWSFANSKNRQIGKNLFEILKNRTVAEKFNPKNVSKKGLDQDFLRDSFWPVAKNNAIIHDSFSCKTFGGEAFPTQRPKVFCFVPCAHCCDEKISNKTWEHICPEACRPKNHKDWIYC